MKFSANLGFLWTDRPLEQAVEAAATAGFEAVEFHWPYETDARQLKEAIDHHGLAVMGINTVRGNAGENGLAALTGRTAEARAAIDQALDWASRLDAANIHVMAGFAEGEAARETLLENLNYAADQAGSVGVMIEPLNAEDVPGYFYSTTEEAEQILTLLNRPEVGIMFDLYHLSKMGESLSERYQAMRSSIKHIQFAGVEGRSEPKPSEYDSFFQLLKTDGWDRPVGAEYKPKGSVTEGLSWRQWYD